MLKRCGYRCEWLDGGLRCWERASDVDHIISGDNHALENLQGLCGTHHLKKTGREARALQLKIKALGRLPDEKQPGIIDGPPTPTQNRGF